MVDADERRAFLYGDSGGLIGRAIVSNDDFVFFTQSLPCLVQGVERFNKALRLVISGDDEGDHGGEFAVTP